MSRLRLYLLHIFVPLCYFHSQTLSVQSTKTVKSQLSLVMSSRRVSSFLLCSLALQGFLTEAKKQYNDVPCEWTSLAGVSFDLKALTKAATEQSYYIKDGDIPCTPEEEPSFSYVWNFCSQVTASSYPDKTVCNPSVEQGAVLQYIDRADGYKECHVIGRYDASNDDLFYKLLSERNPALGVSMTYPMGESCPNGALRSATIDVKCANVKALIDSAQEPSGCQYHLIMESYYGCPKECPITSEGLCNSHGHCHYDDKKKAAYCYCNDGYSGDSCSTKSSSDGSYDGNSVQIGLMATLLIITIGLTGTISWLIYQVTVMRKEKLLEGGGNYSSLSGGGDESTHGASSSSSSHGGSKMSSKMLRGGDTEMTGGTTSISF